jgi:hypothetical protein
MVLFRSSLSGSYRPVVLRRVLLQRSYDEPAACHLGCPSPWLLSDANPSTQAALVSVMMWPEELPLQPVEETKKRKPIGVIF